MSIYRGLSKGDCMWLRCFQDDEGPKEPSGEAASRPYGPMPPWLVLCYIATIVLVVVGVSIIGGQ